ncbi:MAG: hypothetical protein ACOZCL_09810 [Bacillota bacterium]
MRKVLLFLGIMAVVVVAGLLIPALTTVVFGGKGLNIDIVTFANHMFLFSFIPSTVGGLVILFRFFSFSRKVKKTHPDYEVEEDERIIELDTRWDYALLISGIILTFFSYLLVA